MVTVTRLNSPGQDRSALYQGFDGHLSEKDCLYRLISASISAGRTISLGGVASRNSVPDQVLEQSVPPFRLTVFGCDGILGGGLPAQQVSAVRRGVAMRWVVAWPVRMSPPDCTEGDVQRPTPRVPNAHVALHHGPGSPPGGRYADTWLRADVAGSNLGWGTVCLPARRSRATLDRLTITLTVATPAFRRMPLGRPLQLFYGLGEGGPKYAPSDPSQLPTRLP